MKEYTITFILVILSLVIGFFVSHYFERAIHKKQMVDEAPVIEQIRVRNDSILRINDSINFKVINIEKTYEKTIDDIIRNNPNNDYDFFSTYIERYCGRYNSGAIENSESNIR